MTIESHRRNQRWCHLLSGDCLHMKKEGILGTFLHRNSKFFSLATAKYSTESSSEGFLLVYGSLKFSASWQGRSVDTVMG